MPPFTIDSQQPFGVNLRPRLSRGIGQFVFLVSGLCVIDNNPSHIDGHDVASR